MKKFLASLLITMFACTGVAFSMARQPATETYQSCLQKPYSDCKQYGDPWVPNFKYEVENAYSYNTDGFVQYKLDADGNEIPMVLCKDAEKRTVYNYKLRKNVLVPAEPCFDDTKPEYRFNEWKECADAIYAACRLKYGK